MPKKKPKPKKRRNPVARKLQDYKPKVFQDKRRKAIRDGGKNIDEQENNEG